ncbi:MAG: diguanylate cyclase [Desulfobulbaceae bacterium]|nr:diguanylate cyclase [Desulfobulbaceae bacterium]
MNPNFSLTLKQRLWILFVLSWLMVILLALFGGWGLQQFNKKNNDLQQSSLKLHSGLNTNFDNLGLLTDIQTNLRLYMQSASSGTLNKIHQLGQTLGSQLPLELQTQLSVFLEELSTLEIRMNSFRLNNQSLANIEDEILQNTEELLLASPAEFHGDIRRTSIQASHQHHKLYVKMILANDRDGLKQLEQEYEQIFTQIEKQITDLSTLLPSTCTIKFKKLQIAFYKLDEAVSTITAIRLVTLQTKKDIKQDFLSLREAVTQDSLSQANALSALIHSGMSFLKTNLIIMSAIMVTMSFLGGVTALILNQVMVKPLIAFTDMLQSMTRMLSGLRKENEFEQDCSNLLESMTVQRNDEIGQVVTAVKQLLLGLRELALFRQDIENDENTEEIYHRMGRLFSERLNLTSFVIYELALDGKKMDAAFQQIRIKGVDFLQMKLDDHCRVRRNNRIISSFKDRHTCSCFPLPDKLHHVCIPMQVSDQVIGIVQFLFPDDVMDNGHHLVSESLMEARHYIAEALPVLHVRRLTKRLQIMAMVDSLTGLYNRHYLKTTLDRLVAGAKRRDSNVCIMMCDLDKFKDVNDIHGHDAGDLVLSQLAKIFLNSVRDTDLVIRFGGEEFLILLVDIDPQMSCETGERIRREVEEYKFTIPGNSLSLTISIGVSTFIASDTDIKDTLKEADVALYQAKNNGRNQVVFFENPEEPLCNGQSK